MESHPATSSADNNNINRFGSVQRNGQKPKTGMLVFSSAEIDAATNSLSTENIIRRGRYVYRGNLRGYEVAVKVFKSYYGEGIERFMKEIEGIGQLDHKNVVKLIGVCFENRSVVYEYVANGSLEDCIREKPQLLTWELRTRTVYQICTTLLYLHSRPQPLVHRDVTPHNICLDDHLNVKLGESGRSLSLPPGSASEVFVMCNTAGTRLYIDPVYEKSGKLTASCDVYSFGVTILSILTGKNPYEIVKEKEMYMVSWMREAYINDKLMEFVDGKAGMWPENVAKFLAHFALRCCSDNKDKMELMKKGSRDLLMILNVFDISAHEEESIFSLDTLSMLNIRLFSDHDIELATDGYSLELGKGGGGVVYKGHLGDNEEVAIKIIHSDNVHGLDEFRREVEILGALKHENLVKLLGVCVDPVCLVYEYLTRRSVEYCLSNNPRDLNWLTRIRILYQTCSALMFLHSSKPNSIVHGDLKPDNILLDTNCNAKLADFGLSRFLTSGTASKAFIETKVAKGTECYIDPQFLKTKKLTPACDVYSFGVMMLKILIAEAPNNITQKVRKAYKNETLMKLVDGKAGDWPEAVAKTMAYYGLICCSQKRNKWLETLQEISTEFKRILDIIDAENFVA